VRNYTDPKRLDLRVMFRVPGLLAQYTRRVPPEFWTIDDQTAVISCPCGRSPEVPEYGFGHCGCGRFFIYDGRTVRARPPEPEPDPDERLHGLA
jgi:hypothetical protein